MVATGKANEHTYVISDIHGLIIYRLDEDSYSFAQKNISVNDMQSQITLRKASTSGRILFPLEDNVQFEFSMCNPPFYGSAQEVADLEKEKDLPPNAVSNEVDQYRILS